MVGASASQIEFYYAHRRIRQQQQHSRFSSQVFLFFPERTLSFLEALISFIFIVRAAAAHAHVSGDPLFVCLAIFTLGAHSELSLSRGVLLYLLTELPLQTITPFVCSFYLFAACRFTHGDETGQCIENPIPFPLCEADEKFAPTLINLDETWLLR